MGNACTFVPLCWRVMTYKGMDFVQSVLREEETYQEHQDLQKFPDGKMHASRLHSSGKIVFNVQKEHSSSRSARPPLLTERGFPFTGPKYNEMSEPDRRLTSFDNMNIFFRNLLSLDDVVAAGFFFTVRKGQKISFNTNFLNEMSESCSDVVVSQQKAARPPPLALGINVEKPKFPQYAVYSKRMDSFESWPEYIPVKKDDLVEAGLVYTGVGDSVRCYFCGGGLRNWEQGDIPMEEHGKWYPKCPHVMLVKGQGYVEKLQKGEKPEETPVVQTDTACAAPNLLESIAALSCLEFGYSKEIVKKAIDIFIKRSGHSDFKAAQLCEIIMDLEDEIDQLVLKVSDNVPDCKSHIPTEEEELESEELQSAEAIENLKEENLKLKENQVCKICLDKRADVIFLPCGHMVSCPQCAPALSKCPICRKVINGHIKAFFAVTSNSMSSSSVYK